MEVKTCPRYLSYGPVRIRSVLDNYGHFVIKLSSPILAAQCTLVPIDFRIYRSVLTRDRQAAEWLVACVDEDGENFSISLNPDINEQNIDSVEHAGLAFARELRQVRINSVLKYNSAVEVEAVGNGFFSLKLSSLLVSVTFGQALVDLGFKQTYGRPKNVNDYTDTFWYLVATSKKLREGDDTDIFKLVLPHNQGHINCSETISQTFLDQHDPRIPYRPRGNAYQNTFQPVQHYIKMGNPSELRLQLYRNNDPYPRLDPPDDYRMVFYFMLKYDY